MCGLLGSFACKLAGFLLLANKVINGVNPDQLIWLYTFFFKTGFNIDTREDRYQLLSLFSNPDTFYTMLLEMYVTNKTNTVQINMVIVYSIYCNNLGHPAH